MSEPPIAPETLDLTPPPQPAYLLPYGGLDREYAQRIVGIGYPIRGIIDGWAGRDLARLGLPSPVLGADAAHAALQAEPEAAVIVMPRGQDPALAMGGYTAAHDWAPTHTRLLHVASTIPYFQPRFPGLVACVGFPGSGNHVVQAIAQRIQQRAGLAFTGGYEPMCARLAVEHAFLLRGFVDDVLWRQGTPEANFGQGDSQRIECRAVWPDGRYVAMTELPYCGYIGQNFGGHTMMTPRIRALLERFGYRWIRVVRHPVDTIVSNAAKSTRPPSAALNTAAWSDGIGSRMARFAEAARVLDEGGLEVRYEGLLEAPAATIQAMARYMEMPISEEVATTIWDEVGFKPLTDAGEDHLYDPGGAKAQHLSREILAWMTAHGIHRVAGQWQYGWPDAASLPATRRPDASVRVRRVSALYGSIDDAPTVEAGIAGITCRSSDDKLMHETAARLREPRYGRLYGLLGPLA